MTRKSSFRQGGSLNTMGLGWDSSHSLGPYFWALRCNYPRSCKLAVRTQTPSRGLGSVRARPPPPPWLGLLSESLLAGCLCHCAGSSAGGLQCHGGLACCGSLAGAHPCPAGRSTGTQDRVDNPRLRRDVDLSCGSSSWQSGI